LVRRELGFTNIYSVKDRPQLYQMLKSRRVDYLFLRDDVANYYCHFQTTPPQPGCLKQIGSLFKQQNLHVLTMLDNTRAIRLLSHIDQQLTQIGDDPATNLLFAKFGKLSSDVASWRRMLKVLNPENEP
jgi:ABC-type amino acid transport substrate-binding protein